MHILSRLRFTLVGVRKTLNMCISEVGQASPGGMNAERVEGVFVQHILLNLRVFSEM